MEALWAALFLLLQMTSAFSVMGYIPSQSSIHSRSKRSEGHTCSPELVDNLAKTAKETCSQVEVVDNHISNIQARQEVPVPSFADRHGFKAFLGQYNGDLKTAQEHCHLWRDGDNVVASLKQVVVAAQEFEPKFIAELDRNQSRIKNILENRKDIVTIEATVAVLQKSVSEAKEAIKATKFQELISYLENVIKTKEEEINTTMTEHKALVRLALAELVEYLEFVKAGAVDIGTKANAANTKITSFRENLIRDAGAFKRHRTNAQDGIAKLHQDKQNNKNIIKSVQQSINNLRGSIDQENAQIASLHAQIAQAQSEIRKIEDIIGRLPKGTGLFHNLLRKAKERYARLADESRHLVAEANRQLQNLQAHIASRNQEINRHQQQINSLEAKNRELEQELQHFSQLDENLRSLEGEVNAILPSIASAVSGVGKMKENFDSIQQNLGSAIARAKEANTEAEIKNVRYFIYNEIDDIKCSWENARNIIVLVGKCN